jgi:hypothetical protein
LDVPTLDKVAGLPWQAISKTSLTVSSIVNVGDEVIVGVRVAVGVKVVVGVRVIVGVGDNVGPNSLSGAQLEINRITNNTFAKRKQINIVLYLFFIVFSFAVTNSRGYILARLEFAPDSLIDHFCLLA